MPRDLFEGMQQSVPRDLFADQPSQYDVTSDMSTGEKVMAGIGKGFVDIGRGVGQRLGMVSQAEIDEAKKLDEPLMHTGAGMTGNVIGNIAAAIPTMAIPGAGTIAGATAIGGALGAIQPTATGESMLGNVAGGAAFGGVGAAIPKAIARVVNPNAVQRVSESVGTLTPGQALGGAWKTAEEKATSLPFAGPIIQKAQQGSVESFNKGVINKALEPIGQSIDEIGHEGVKNAGDLISKSYQKLLPELKIQADEPFMAQIQGVKDLAQSLPEEKAAQLTRILDQKVTGKFTDDGLMSGETMKQVDSELGRMIRGYKSSPNFDERQLGDALRETQSALRTMVERNNPDKKGQLSAINDAFAKFIRVERAASGVGTKEGVFTPAQLLSASKATDSSLRKGQFARGGALMQDVAEQGKQNIGGGYPDSGTAGRMLGALGAGGAYVTNPLLALGEAGIAATYASPKVRNALVSLIAKRPDEAAKWANKLRLASPATGRIGAVGGAAYLNQK
jgi:hypothetical protein